MCSPMRAISIKLKGGSIHNSPLNPNQRDGTEQSDKDSDEHTHHSAFQTQITSRSVSNYASVINSNPQPDDEDNPRISNETIESNLKDDLRLLFHNVRSFELREHQVTNIISKHEIDHVILLETMNKVKWDYFEYKDFSNLYKSNRCKSSGIFLGSNQPI